MNRGQSFLLLLIALVSVLTLVIISPFFEYVIASVILAYVLFPFHEFISTRLAPIAEGRNALTIRATEMASAVVLILGSIIAVIIPFVYISFVFVQDLTAIAAGESDIDIVAIEARIAELTGEEFDIEGWFITTGDVLLDTLFGGLGGILTSALRASLGLALAVFLVYYTLMDGPQFVSWLRSMIPLPADVTDDLLTKVDATTRGVVIGHISVALLQALIAGAGLWAVGIPNVVFWTFVMAILALLPLIGAFLVWGPAAAYLVVIDEVTAGVLLAIYGVAVVSMVDNYARPIVIDQQAHLNPGVILVGVFGGVYSIGFTGLFVGPIVIGVLAATLETFREDYDAI